MKKIITTTALILMLFITSGCTNTKNTEDNIDIPNVVLQNYQNEDIQLQQYLGTPLIINSWAKWCTFCKNELPLFAEVQQQFDEQIKIIIINRRESLESSKTETDKLEVTDKLISLIDNKDSFYTNIGGFTMPETIFINAQGKIIHHKRGPLTKDEMITKIKDILPK